MKQVSNFWSLPLVSIFRHPFHLSGQLAAFAIFMFAAMPASQSNNGLRVLNDIKVNTNSSFTADLSLTKSVNNSNPAQNSTVTYTLTLSNAGPDPATDVEVTDVVPAGLTFVPGSMTGPGTYVNSNPGTTGLKWQHIVLTSGGSAVLTFQATVTGTGTIINFAQVTSSVESDPDSSPNNGTSPTPAEDDEAAVSITVNQPVMLTCPVNTTVASCQTQAAVDAQFTAWLATASGTGGCNGVLTNNNTGAPPACGGSVTVTFTYTSTCAPLTTTCQATFTVNSDTTPPVISGCPPPSTNLGCNPATIPTCANVTPPTASDNCGNATVSCTETAVTVNGCQHTKTITWTATDGCNNTASCSTVYTWTQATAPVFDNCVIGTTNLGCNPTLPVCATNITAQNECGPVAVTCLPGIIFSSGCNRVQTFIYLATACGFTTQCSRTYIWTETTAPVFDNCVSGTTDLGCNPTPPVCATNITAHNECGSVPVTCNPGTIVINGCTRTQTFTYTATACGLTTTCSRTFTWTVDTTPPVLSGCPPPTVALGCNPATIPTCANVPLPTATDACGTPTVTCNETGITVNGCLRSKTITWTATDGCSNTASCSTNYSWSLDTSMVVLNCPVNATVAACQTQVAVNTQFAAWLATANFTGGCNGVLTNNNSGAPSACGGSTTVTFTVTTVCGQPTTCSATFTVSAPPTVVLTCPVNATVASCQTQASVNAQFAAWLATASGSGGCNGVLTNNNQGAPSACGGSTTVVFTYTSSCAPTTTICTATFTVAAPPTVVLSCPVNLTVASCQTQAAVNAQFAAWLATASGSGGCNGVLTNNNQGAPSACGGSTTVVFTYTSSCAPITTTCTATFTVPAPPTVVLTCPVNLTVASCQTQAAINAQFAAWLATASASGGCNGVLTNNNTGAPAACGGSTTVTFTYTSTCAPFTTTCTATFTVPAPPPVVLTCPVNTTVSPCLTQAQMNSAYAAWLASASASGGCNGVLTNNSIGAPLICSPVAVVRTVVFTYTSSCAPFTTTCTATFTLPAYPDFTVPANTAIEVACPSQIVQPTPPVVLDACGKTITPTGPVIVNNPNPITCEGTRTYTWTYTDCSGHAHAWSHTVTVERQPFSVPANGSATVACPDDSDVTPTPPVVTSNCGEILIPVVSSTPKPGCEGDRLYTFHYTDCEGNTADWFFTYHVEYLDFTLPANETVSVECPLNASEPVPPVVIDNCGKLLNAVGPTITSTNNSTGCEGSRTYAWKYQDCEGNTHVWSKTFIFLYTSDFFVYPDGEDFVGCLLYAQPPIPPTIYDNCGNEIIASGPVVTGDVNDCSGTLKYTYTYQDCGGHSHEWNYTYHAADTEPPVGNCPSGSLSSVDVTDIDCIEDVPCPDDYDFSSKIAELIAAGNIYDVCSGNDINVELDSWSELWLCSDPDGDGNYTFGRTFYFRISDQCGNEMPSLCPITYSGSCLPIQTFSQSDWGNEGGEPGTETPGTPTDLQLITTLLGQGPLMIGGTHRSMTFTNAQCMLNLMPGAGYPTPLANCIQTNCVGCNPAGIIGMKNSLATNTMALILNMRYNVQFNGLSMAQVRSQGLGCLDIDANIKVCVEPGGCKLHLFESDGTEHVFPYTLGGLLDLANLFLDGNLALSGGQQALYANAIHNSITNANAYWDGLPPTITCDPNPGMAPFTGDDDSEKFAGKGSKAETVEFSLAPNPASGEVVFSLPKLEESQPVTFEIYSSYGKQIFRKEYGKVSYVRDRVSLNDVKGGLYFVTVKAGGARSVQKLYISKD